MENQKKKIRLSDIAEKLNISTVTVSKALSNKDGVGDDLRNQIKALAEEMGYKVKKGTADSEKAASTGNIGVLIPSHFFDPNYSYYWYIFTFLSKELMNRNYYTIMELISKEDEEALTVPRILKEKKVDGVILLGQVSPEYLNTFHSHYDNFILLDFYSNNSYIDSVSDDDFYYTYLLTSYVISQGHKNIRFVGKFNTTTSIKDRYMGFQKALFENNLTSNFEDIVDDRISLTSEIKINLPPKEKMPTAFVCNSDETAAYLIEELNKNGYKVPEDISVTGFDNYLGKKTLDINLTTVYIRPEDTAQAAADLIIKKINGQPYIKGRHLVKGSLLIRNSVKKI